ncbi:GNAT family N-acetyltransferase [Pseudoxanthomonas sangjuensis]|uniref:GNAT family N-acetyltransferase n=1 Tax=Pseudoxanthomonas sangjuensis TaxID=1503750 RepID=UPI00139133B2|nr:GNAT family N-acetyltransferase [Pseudoxanthomonas sangjuensis]KAF1713887.1 hypothetical protein CSC71_05785 [Pseudoxanthomonas sangjuensis]
MTVTIRQATRDDVPAIVAMSEKFYANTVFAEWFEFNPETVADIAATLASGHVMLLAEQGGRVVGMVGLWVLPFVFNTRHCAAYEVVWWVNPDAQGSGVGKALLDAIEPACKERGAEVIHMVHMANSPPQAAALYERLGYAHSESAYAKKVV